MQKEFVKMERIKMLRVSSEAFNDKEFIPSKYTCDGQNVNPPLEIQNIPLSTRSLALVVEDSDGPIRSWVHWIVWNIAPTRIIKEKSIPGIEGKNDCNDRHYGGPCPPTGTHRYCFKVYALDDVIYLPITATRNELEKMVAMHIVGYGELMGLYKRVLG